MPILNKSEVFPLATYMAQKEGASAHKFNKALEICISQAQEHSQTPWPMTEPQGGVSTSGTFCYKPDLTSPVNPRVEKHRLLEVPALGKEWQIQSWGKALSSTLHPSQLLSEVKQHRVRGSRGNTPSSLPERSSRETSLSRGCPVWHPCMARLAHTLRGGSLPTHQILLVLPTLAHGLQVGEEHDLTDNNMY